MFGQIQSALECQIVIQIIIQIITQSAKLSLRDPLQRKSKVSQKLCCDKLCEVAVLKELVDGTLERGFTKATHASVGR